MPSRIPDSVLVTVPIVVLLVGIGAVVLSLSGGAPPDPSPAAPVISASRPSGTPADHGSPAPTRPTTSLPSATATVCVSLDENLPLTVLTFNIHSARAHDGSVHLDTIARELEHWDADVVLLQEVDRGRLWTGQVDMPAVLATRLGMAWTFGANVTRSPTNQYGTAILSRYPIVGSSNTPLPAPPGTQQRGLLQATIDIRGIRMSVYGTHLESSSPEARLQQIRTIAPILSADQRPKLFGGDLNAVPGSPVLATARTAVADTWTAAGTGVGLTAPAGNPRVRIDYLLHGDGTDVDVAPVRAQVLRSAVSDHRAVRAAYRISTDEEEICVPVLREQRRRR